MNTPSSSPRTRNVPAIALALLAIASVLPTLRNVFIYDDTSIIRDNAAIRGWASILRVWTEPYWPGDGASALGLYRPLHVALLSLVWNAGGGSATWMHAYALLLAGATTVGAWWLLRRGVGWAPAALLAAAWFAVHPLHVEAVASVANTSELLVVLCIIGMTWLLTIPDEGNGALSWTRALGVGALAGAALASKESGALALPVAALSAWGWRASAVTMPGLRPELLRTQRAWAAASVALAAVILARLAVLGAPVSHASIAAQGIGTMSAPERIAAMSSIWPRIGGMLAWPASLSPYYGPTVFPSQRIVHALLGASVAVALVVLALLVARRGDRRPLVAVAWVVLTYLPASNLVMPTGQVLADRTLFGATLGAACAVAWTLDRLAPAMRRVALLLCILLVGRDALVSTRYAIAWTSHRALWTRLAEVFPEEHMSYKLLGMDARARGDTARAVALLTRAAAMAPHDRQVRFELGQALYGSRRYAAASNVLAPLLRDADVRSEPGFVALYLDAVGRGTGAAAVVASGRPLLRSESAPVAALYVGLALEQLGQRARADTVYLEGLRRAPGDSALLARRAALAR